MISFSKSIIRRHTRLIPAVESNGKLVGIITSRDVVSKPDMDTVGKVMTPDPITVNGKMSVASAGHSMIWEGIDLMPVVSDAGILEGIISRQDVLKALQMTQRQPQQGETIDDIVKNQMKVIPNAPEKIEFSVVPQMTNQFGSLSYGAMLTILNEAGSRAIRLQKRGESVPENVTIYFIKQVQLGAAVTVVPKILHTSRRFIKLEIELFSNDSIVAKAMGMFQLFEK